MRAIVKSDIEAVYGLCQLLKGENARMSFTDVETAEDVSKWLEDQSVYLYGAFDLDGKILGLIKATRGRGNKSHSAYLAAAVHPNARKKNIATDLTLYALAELKKEGLLIARTYIYSWNTASINTIEKCGFIQSGRVFMHEYDTETQGFIDDLIYYKCL